MKEFSYTIKDELGIHARPAGMLVKECKKYQSKIIIMIDQKEAEATKLMAIMSMGIKCGNTIKVTVTGPDEEQATEEIRQFLQENL